MYYYALLVILAVAIIILHFMGKLPYEKIFIISFGALVIVMTIPSFVVLSRFFGKKGGYHLIAKQSKDKTKNIYAVVMLIVNIILVLLALACIALELLGQREWAVYVVIGITILCIIEMFVYRGFKTSRSNFYSDEYHNL